MAFDGITLSALVSEWKRALSGGRIQKISQPEADELFLTIKTDNTYYLQLSASASLPLACLRDETKAAPMTAPAFCMLLRKHLNGGRILDILQPDLERVVQFKLQHLNEMGDTCVKYLIIELMGKYSNIIFTTEDYQIIDSIKRVNSFVSSVREVLPGKPWFIPKTNGKHSLLSEAPSALCETLAAQSGPVSAAIYRTVTGLSPVIANELCCRAGINPELPAAELSDSDRSSLAEIFGWLRQRIETESYTPVIYKKDGVPVEFAPVPLRTFSDYPEYEVIEKQSISDVVLGYYQEKDTVTRMRAKSADLRKTVQNAIERTAKKLDLQRKQMDDTRKKDRFRIYGELLTTYGYSAEPGSKAFTCMNYYDNTEITIPLDPTLTALENAKKYFDKYAKLRRTGEALTEQLAASEAELNHLESVKESLAFACAEADLNQIKTELTDCGYLKFHREPGAKKSRPQKSKPYHYRTKDGFDLFVGKNNYQNDDLTFNLASGGDWWFHAKGIPGSHVILKTGGREVPDELFNIAGSLAAYYSSGREGGGKVEVDYLLRKNVKKPNGAKPGFVVYYTNYSLVASPGIDEGLTEVME
ncbi:MAG: NFACT family protein [Lachnospiraceae bacterium]|nr:NFACT family protein [Lachnospiraceae bacterium]